MRKVDLRHFVENRREEALEAETARYKKELKDHINNIKETSNLDMYAKRVTALLTESIQVVEEWRTLVNKEFGIQLSDSYGTFQKYIGNHVCSLAYFKEELMYNELENKTDNKRDSIRTSYERNTQSIKDNYLIILENLLLLPTAIKGLDYLKDEIGFDTSSLEAPEPKITALVKKIDLSYIKTP